MIIITIIDVVNCVDFVNWCGKALQVARLLHQKWRQQQTKQQKFTTKIRDTIFWQKPCQKALENLISKYHNIYESICLGKQVHFIYVFRYLNFEPSFKLRWCRARDLFGSQIPVTTGGFELQISCIRSN